MTIPNKLTVFRLGLIVPLLVCINWRVPALFPPGLILFWLAFMTDILDGYIARRYKMETDLGGFLDAQTDKLMNLCLLFSFFRLGLYPAWLLFPMFLRDILGDSLRSYAAKMGTVLPANIWGKTKFGLQFISINFCFLYYMAGPNRQSGMKCMAEVFLGLALAASIFGAVILVRQVMLVRSIRGDQS